MSFDQGSYVDMFKSYVSDCVEIELVRYLETDGGVNIDVGETVHFDLRVRNNGDLGLLNVYVGVQARRGQVSQSHFGPWDWAASHWMEFRDSMVLAPFNLGPNQQEKFHNPTSIGYVPFFAYRADEPTAGTDNDREIEDLVTATLLMWQPDVQKMWLQSTEPTDTFRDFVQRD